MLKETEVTTKTENFDAFDLLMKDIETFPLLTKEEEQSLARIYIYGKECELKMNDCLENKLPIDMSLEISINNGKEAREKFINSNLRLIKPLAYLYSGTDNYGNKIKDDVIYNFFSGCEGLLKAVDRFDPNKRIKFSTYAYRAIENTIKNNLRWENIFATRWVRNLVIKLNRIEDEYIQKYGEQPSNDFLINELGITKVKFDTIITAYKLNGGKVSLDKAEDGDESEDYYQKFEDYDLCFIENYSGVHRPTEVEALNNILFKNISNEIYKYLDTPMRRDIFNQLIILELENSANIADKYGVTPQGISYVKTRLLKKLREDKNFVSACLDYLGVRDYPDNDNPNVLD